MKQQSRRKKAQYLQNWIRKKLLKTFKHLKKSDVHVAKTGEHGIDIKLSRIGKRLVPYQIEAKNTERFKTIYNLFDVLYMGTRDFVIISFLGRISKNFCLRA
jgi:deoxyribodipyrimidine photolyase-like uncharacterized protein